MHWWSHRTGGGVASAMARAIASDIIIPGNEFVRTCMYVMCIGDWQNSSKSSKRKRAQEKYASAPFLRNISFIAQIKDYITADQPTKPAS